VLVLGWNDHLARLLVEYDICQGPPADITVVAGFPSEEAAERLAAAGVTLTRIAPVFRRADTLLPGVIASLQPEKFDAVVILADTSWSDADPDARTVMTLLMLREHLRATGSRPRLSAEVLDHATGEAAASLGIDDLVVGPHLISQQLVQIAEQSMIAAVYHDLLSSGGMDVYLKPAGRYVRLDTEATFRDLVYSAQHLAEVALGVWLARPRQGWTAGLHLAPPRTAIWQFEAEDQIVVLAEDLYDVPSGGTAAIHRNTTSFHRKDVTPGFPAPPGSPG
jgi:hypothetical protein